MNNTLLALVVGLLAGAVGAFLPTLLSSGEREATPQTSDLDLRPILDRLDRIERTLEERHTPPVLRGTTPKARPERDEEALVARIEEVVERVLRESSRDPFAAPSPPPPPQPTAEAEEEDAYGKEATLAEAARDLELTSHEETELRRIHEESYRLVLEALARDDEGGVDGLLRDIREASENPEQSEAIRMKYLVRMMSNIGPFFMIEGMRTEKVNKLLGEEKASRFDDYALTDLDPHGLEEFLDVWPGD